MLKRGSSSSTRRAAALASLARPRRVKAAVCRTQAGLKRGFDCAALFSTTESERDAGPLFLDNDGTFNVGVTCAAGLSRLGRVPSDAALDHRSQSGEECLLGIAEPRDAQLDAHHLGGRLRHQQIELVGAERLFGLGAPDPRAMGLLVNGIADIALLEHQLGPQTARQRLVIARYAQRLLSIVVLCIRDPGTLAQRQRKEHRTQRPQSN